MRAILAFAVVAACGKAAPPAPAPSPAEDTTPACEPLPFATSIPLAEASGAALIPDGLLVVADSGNHGAYVIVDPETGALVEQGHLPLPDGVSDDLEGLSTVSTGVTVLGLISDGTLVEWKRADHAFTLVKSSRITDRRDDNFEGLCLYRNAPPGRCAGFAASKADGRLHCFDGVKLDPDVSFEIARPDQLADCSVSPDGTVLLAGGNVFTADMVWRVDPNSGAVTELAHLGPGNGEVVVAAPDGVVYRFSDLNVAPSLAGKYRCRALAR